MVAADPAALVAAARAAGATLQPEGAAIRATGLAALPPELADALRRHRDEAHLWLCAEAAALPDQADEEARLELANQKPRPGCGWRPHHGDALAAGLLTGFHAHRPCARAPRRAIATRALKE